ncbi:glycoside hydrolase family protein [Hamadaea tsunoensis]|uniref:hypothetical protein n=1 Tax=Hamadaea tsunoensis TaxID=53368 RepID=UPI00041A3CFD|nr:hypothetical protein [Hamadaea tsunoensis]
MKTVLRTVAIGLTLALAVLSGTTAVSAQAGLLDAADESQDFPFPGADTIALHDGSDQYISYGASAHGRNVPYAVSGSGNVVGTSPVIAGDAMPAGGGAWVEDGSGIWTPGAWYQVKDGVGRYYLFYTATHRNDNGRKCIGVARSQNPFGPFNPESTPIVCPDKGDRWALDADVTQGPEGAICGATVSGPRAWSRRCR